MNGFQRKIIARAEENINLLTSGDIDFIESLKDKQDDYKLSEKQNQWLNRILQKLDR